MGDAADLRTEIAKLARLLDVEPTSLGFLEPAGWLEVRQLRQVISDRFFAAGEPRLRNLAAIAKIVPVQVIVKIAPLVFEPRMGAGLASLIDEDKALKLVPKLPPDMLASAVPYIDPRRVGPLAAKIPVEVTQKILPFLLAGEEHAAMAQFIDYVTPEQLDGLLPYIDDAALLKIIEVVENREQFRHIMPLVSDVRLARLITTAKELGQLQVIFEVLEYVDAEMRARMTGIAIMQSDSVLEAFLGELSLNDRFELLLSAIPLMGRSELIRLARHPKLAALSTMKALFAAARRTGDWAAAMRLLPVLTPDARAQLVHSRLWNDPATVHAAVESAMARLDTEPTLLVSFLRLSAEVPASDRELFANALANTDEHTFRRAVDTAIASGGAASLLSLTGAFPESRQRLIAEITADLDVDQMRSALIDANDNGMLSELFNVAAEMPREAREQIVTIIAESPDDDLLSSASSPELQQQTWNGLLKLTDDLPSQLVSKLGEQVSMLSLDDVLPLIVKAGQATGRLATSFTLLDEVNKIAEGQGIPVEIAMPANVLKTVAEHVSHFAGDDSPLAELRASAESVPATAAAEAVVSVSLEMFKSVSAATSRAAVAAGEKTLGELAEDAVETVSGVASKLLGLTRARPDAAAGKDDSSNSEA